ncbi:hypothetical protein RM780_14335 [Streptomyces sp. DSM 44917]|uniref:Lipoprotein n=1 Tax=Streptomyces boetiae TaxID=3075541 RepID=A0ABU2L977_9ACTN|nr:hypothetical protein [Streptomyces sp. DSM 44917]MDT0308132.1 hypothetical protein [Streptomyces sp. DSM 44917]
MSARTAGRALARRTAAAALLLAATAAACGIRPTDVPVDAGPGPVRSTCETESDAPLDDSGDAEETEVFLLCGSHVESVERPISLPRPETGEAGPDYRVTVARALLSALQAGPDAEETDAGFTSAVPGALQVAGPGEGDPQPTLRLSQEPKALPAVALVQIICTFANSERLDGNGRTVLLAGPGASGGGTPEPYACTPAMLSDPEFAHAPPGASA